MFFLAIKHLMNRPHQTALTIIGITLGAAGYIVFSGIQLGYQDFVIDRLINVDAYVRISPRDEIITKETFRNIFFHGSSVKWVAPPSGRISNTYLTNSQGWFNRLKAEPDVVAYSPQLMRDVMFSYRKFSFSVRLIGINPETQRRVTNIEKDIIHGTLSGIGQGDSLLLIGEELMKKLGARPGDSISVITQNGAAYQAKIAGVFNTGIKQIDSKIAYSSISTVQKITQSPGEISDIVVRLKDVYKSADTATEWSRYTTDKVESWDQSKQDIRVTLKTQNIVRNSTTLTIMIIISFGIYNILNMVVNQKKREIAILRSIGYDQYDTIFLFLVQGIILGLAGSALGLLIGAASCLYIESIKIDAGSGHMPVSWETAIYVKALIIVMSSSILASFIPARHAGRLSPIDIIRGA